MPYHYLAATHGRTLGSPRGRAGAKRLRGEAPPRAGELAQGAKRPVTERAIAQRPNGFIADCMVMLFFHFFPLDSGLSMVYITR